LGIVEGDVAYGWKSFKVERASGGALEKGKNQIEKEGRDDPWATK